jgi:hypothetical protein
MRLEGRLGLFHDERQRRNPVRYGAALPFEVRDLDHLMPELEPVQVVEVNIGWNRRDQRKPQFLIHLIHC